ncbi:RidA family protein [Agrobacterium vitis]|uniref:RidA family protein n=1 Tax=Agrobacterium vitis TaxID=373 RepID=UPI0012E90BB7|nr:RidA family protein [Agrobacterium vitis]MVA12283.1 RidA family protein [Agrobacterium vitis]
MIRHLNPASMPAPVAPLYAQISIAPAGPLAFIAGQVAIDADGRLIGKGDHRLQAEQCFRNLRDALDVLGVGTQHVVRMGLHVVRHSDELVGPIFEAGHAVFEQGWPVCASLFLGVEALGHSDWLVEIDAIVSLPVDSGALRLSE